MGLNPTPETVAIMQPTYLPWLGYFDLMRRVDLFVLLDCVQFEKRSWQQRNRVKLGDEAVWLTVPVTTKGRFTQRIDEVLIDGTQSFPDKHINRMRHAYARAPSYTEVAPLVEGILGGGHKRLVDLNAELITGMADLLGVDTPVIRSSTLDVGGAKDERLALICGTLGAGRYLAAAGSRRYLHEGDAFERRGIEVTYHDYQPREYRQLGATFLPYLSAVDFLFNEGRRDPVAPTGAHSGSSGPGWPAVHD